MNLGALLERAAVRYPDCIAWGEVTYRAVNARVNRLANALIGAGVGPGDRVATRLWNCPEAIELMFAAWRAGAVIAPLNARLLDSEVTPLLEDIECRLLFRDGPFDVKVPGLRTIEIGLEYEAFLAAGSDTFSRPTPRQDDVAWIIFTSGTTAGKPKGAMLSHRNLLSMVATFNIDVVRPQPTDAVMHVIPLSFAAGFFLLHHIAAGARNVFLPTRSVDPDMVVELAEREGVTSVALVTGLIANLVDTGRPRPSRLHTVFYGGNSPPIERSERNLAAWGRVFVQCYGLVETCAGVSMLQKHEHEGNLLRSAGRPTTIMDVSIIDGEIAVRGDLLMRGYWNRPDVNAEVFRDGWFLTGDIGHFDEAGYLYVTDRKKEIIKTGGSTVSPREVEEAIYKHPAVLETVVFGIPDEKWGEAVTALVVLHPGASATEAEIIETCRKHIASYKRPQSVEFVSAIAKGTTGKPARRDLRDRYLAARARKD